MKHQDYVHIFIDYNKVEHVFRCARISAHKELCEAGDYSSLKNLAGKFTRYAFAASTAGLA